LGSTEFIADNLNEMAADDLQEIMTGLKNSASKLYNLLENLLEWARMKRGMIGFTPEILNLKELTAEVISGLEESAKNKQVAIINSISTDIEVFADRNMLNGILRNLASNALKFSLHNGSISFQAFKTDDSMIRISVTDTGIGMSDEILENLFRLDVNVSRPGTDGEPSTGLGLQLCKEFIEKHGGQIWAESQVGVGTTFNITLKKR
jgi:signal transduction histidine kinase